MKKNTDIFTNRDVVRVLHVTTSLISGGVQSLLLSYGKSLLEYNIIFDYVLQENGDRDKEERLKNSGSKLYYIPRFNKHPLKAIISLCKILKNNPNYNIIHCHLNYLNILPLLAAKISHIKVRISHSHSSRPTLDFATKIKRKLAQALQKCVATDFWACGESAFKWLFGFDYFINKNNYILNNAIETKKFAFNQNIRNSIRNEYKNFDHILICVATLTQNKNQEFLLKVLLELLKKDNRYALLLVGSGEDMQYLNNKVREIGLNEHVFFLGNKLNVNELLSASDCFLLASHSEGFSISIVEAAANGLPCVISNKIPGEVVVSPNIYQIGIEDSSIYLWVNRIIECCSTKQTNRFRMDSDMSIRKYDINYITKELAMKYLEMIKR